MQKSIPILLTAAALVLSPVLAGPASAQLAVDAPGHVYNTVDIPVTVDNFVRAASDFEFRRYAQLEGAGAPRQPNHDQDEPRYAL